MSKKRNAAAERLFNSPRGQLVISQALTIAIEKLTTGPTEQQAPCAAADMLFLRDGMFPLYTQILKGSEEDAKQQASTK